jgi:proline iminopeptidase
MFRLVYYDHRGNGRSGRPPLETLTFERFSADADALRVHLNLGKVVVLGHSYGSFIALDYALRYSQQVSRLILISAAPAVDYWDQICANMKQRGATDGMIKSFQSGRWKDDRDVEQHFHLLGPLNFSRSKTNLAEQVFQHTIYCATAREAAFRLVRDYNLTARLGSVTAPTLIIVGREDVFTPPSQAERIHKGIPGPELLVFEKSGHSPYVEEPEAFFSAIRGWLARTSGRRNKEH